MECQQGFFRGSNILQGIELPTLLVVLQQMELSCMEGLRSDTWSLFVPETEGIEGTNTLSK